MGSWRRNDERKRRIKVRLEAPGVEVTPCSTKSRPSTPSSNHGTLKIIDTRVGPPASRRFRQRESPPLSLECLKAGTTHTWRDPGRLDRCESHGVCTELVEQGLSVETPSGGNVAVARKRTKKESRSGSGKLRRQRCVSWTLTIVSAQSRQIPQIDARRRRTIDPRPGTIVDAFAFWWRASESRR